MIFRNWVRKVPRSNDDVWPLGSGLAEFFQEASQLVDTDAGLLQAVVGKLANEGGLRRIKELLEQDFQRLSPTGKEQAFRLRLLPFFRIVTKAEVLDSLVLETEVARIYSFIFGINGARVVPIFPFVAEVLNATNKQTESFVMMLEHSITVFCKVLDFNTSASVQPLAEPARQLEEIFKETCQIHDRFALIVTEKYLERLFRRLDLGLSFPTSNPVLEKRSNKSPTAPFVTRQDPPGGRHDNDFEDICAVRILPTFAEINNQRSEYLPSIDPSQWHIAGVDGLLDRNFRLLREDTVGQLRDTIQQELQLLGKDKNTKISKSKDRIRTLVYPGAVVSALSIAKRPGFHFEIQFPQPDKVRKMTVKDRLDWWGHSKRLQPDALICLIDSKGLALFCTVLNPPGSSNDQRRSNRDRDCLELFKHPGIASTYLALVEPDATSVQEILRRHHSHSGTFSVVEFPGVLLPAFYPTLEALQKIKKSGDLPFAEFLAPSRTGGYIEVRAPTYAMQPGFTFNLRPVMRTSAKETLLKPGLPFDIDALTQESSLDEAQAASLIDALTHRLSLIQGPPGTGKSYTGVAILKVLLARKKLQKLNKNFGPILCICYTNHALDQLLEDVLDSGITTQLIRVGSQSKSDRLKDYNLRAVIRSVDKTREERHNSWAMNEKMDKLEEEFLAASQKLCKASSGASIRDHLQERHRKWYLELFGDDEDGFQKVGKDKPETVFRTWLQCKSIANQSQQTNEDDMSVHAFPKKRRHALYYGWIHRITGRLEAELRSITSDFREAQERYSRIQDECDLRCLRQADIIGVTTSGLARKLEVLRRAQSKIMLCEEAGEVLEPHLLAALLPSLEHTILIGDHMQLRPQVQNFELSRENHRSGAKYCLDVSLFERLVEPNVDCAVQLPYSTLQIQRRMHPSISQLIRETLYPALKDHESVSEYPQVPGMRKRLFWLEHKQGEGNSSDDATATSYWNNFELDMVTAIVTHLVQQGKYKSGEVAILTPYLGQLHRLRQRLRSFFAITIDERDELELKQAGLAEDAQPQPIQGPAPAKSTLLQALRVATIDNFQGEEAKVVIISLKEAVTSVASNDYNVDTLARNDAIQSYCMKQYVVRSPVKGRSKAATMLVLNLVEILAQLGAQYLSKIHKEHCHAAILNRFSHAGKLKT
ncbi:hypothetical protein MMC10_007287 [Thelotrema lepadinum]|nr:hypothetical protein [Thelotrema lepadinum]